MTASDLLTGVRVVDLSDNVAGLYASRLLRDLGANVSRSKAVPVSIDEPGIVDNDEVRAEFYRALTDGFEIVADEMAQSRILTADIVFTGAQSGDLHPREIRRSYPGITVVSITDAGLEGPLGGRRLPSIIKQALAGSVFWRGDPDEQPLMAAGEIEQFLGGAYAATAAIAGLRSSRQSGKGDHFDLSLLEVTNLGLTTVGSTVADLWSKLGEDFPTRTVQIPAIERTSDGWIGLCTISAQQRRDMALIVGRSDLADSEGHAYSGMAHSTRMQSLRVSIEEWARTVTTAEAMEVMAALRIPAAEIGRGDTLLDNPQLVHRQFFTAAGDGIPRPRQPFTSQVKREVTVGQAPARGNADELPLSDVRILDLTAWWAGPAATHILAALGAEVIKIESTPRPDGMRLSFVKDPASEEWWEKGPVYAAVNTNKIGITIDFTTVEGRQLLQDLASRSDILIENFSPRVLDSIGLDWELLEKINPGLITVRMPAFGTDGPWRDRTAYAQTIEQSSGLSWVTGHPESAPRSPRGVCDPLAGVHAALAALAALEYRDRAGKVALVEVTMIEPAAYAAWGQVLSWKLTGEVLERIGNSSRIYTPQGVFEASHQEEWVALCVDSDQAWGSLVDAVGESGLNRSWSQSDRHAMNSQIMSSLGDWFGSRSVDDAVESLGVAGVLAVRVNGSGRVVENEQFKARSFFETVEHPVIGKHIVPGLPFRSEKIAVWNRSPAPTLGQHTDDVLRRLLGLTEDDISALSEAQIIGERPTHLVETS